MICFGPDPLFTRYPFREFEGDLLISGESCATFTMLREALGDALKGGTPQIAARRKVDRRGCGRKCSPSAAS